MVASFEIDHRTLKPGIYERSRKFMTKSWDIRFVAPSKNMPMTPGAMHVLEHCFAQWLREQPVIGGKIIAVCPMGCLTGMYIITSESATMMEIVTGLKSVLEKFPLRSIDEVPGMNEIQCGNPMLYDIDDANRYARILKNVMAGESQHTILETNKKGGTMA